MLALLLSISDTLLSSCRRCFASLFTDRAISCMLECLQSALLLCTTTRLTHHSPMPPLDRTTKGFDHFSIGLSIAVQKMVRSDEGASGVMFTIDTETGFQNAVRQRGTWLPALHPTSPRQSLIC